MTVNLRDQNGSKAPLLSCQASPLRVAVAMCTGQKASIMDSNHHRDYDHFFIMTLDRSEAL